MSVLSSVLFPTYSAKRWRYRQLIARGRVEEFNELRARDNAPKILEHRFLARFAASKLHIDLPSMLDFGGMNLTGVELAGINLQYAFLQHADLQGANLSGADLSHARLDHADLRGANLCGAALEGAWLFGTRIANAKMSCEQLELFRMSGIQVLKSVEII